MTRSRATAGTMIPLYLRCNSSIPFSQRMPYTHCHTPSGFPPPLPPPTKELCFWIISQAQLCEVGSSRAASNRGCVRGSAVVGRIRISQPRAIPPRGRAARPPLPPRGPGTMAKLLVFDLDGTLYLETNGYPSHCRRRAAEYLADKFDMTVSPAANRRPNPIVLTRIPHLVRAQVEEAEAKRKLALKVKSMRERARKG